MNRLGERYYWLVSMVCSALSVGWVVWYIKIPFDDPINLLILGMLPACLALSSYWCLRLVAAVDSKGGGLPLTTGVVVSIAFLLLFSWLVYGGFFYYSAVRGLQSTGHLAIEYSLRSALHFQHILTAGLSVLVVIRRGGGVDIGLSAIIFIVFGVLMFG